MLGGRGVGAAVTPALVGTPPSGAPALGGAAEAHEAIAAEGRRAPVGAPDRAGMRADERSRPCHV
ncbi:hypothetical protein [Sorangium sp. So ce204]|uniref:hypothetical protein n=1 Tax=Sorangium sp. So ce204 TaxID=3133288 RepID=UPI003F5FC2C6